MDKLIAGLNEIIEVSSDNDWIEVQINGVNETNKAHPSNVMADIVGELNYMDASIIEGCGLQGTGAYPGFTGSNCLDTSTDIIDALELLDGAIPGISAQGNTLIFPVNITSAQILSGNTTPILCISAPSLTQMIEIISIVGTLTYSIAPYATNTKLEIYTDTSTVNQFECSYLLSATSNTTLKFSQSAISSSSSQLIAGKAIYARVGGGDPINGHGTLKLYFLYRKITV